MMDPAKVDKLMKPILAAHWGRYRELIRWELVHWKRGNQHTAMWRKALFDERDGVRRAYQRDCDVAGLTEYDLAKHCDRVYRASIAAFGPVKSGSEIMLSVMAKNVA